MALLILGPTTDSSGFLPQTDGKVSRLGAAVSVRRASHTVAAVAVSDRVKRSAVASERNLSECPERGELG